MGAVAPKTNKQTSHAAIAEVASSGIIFMQSFAKPVYKLKWRHTKAVWRFRKSSFPV